MKLSSISLQHRDVDGIIELDVENNYLTVSLSPDIWGWTERRITPAGKILSLHYFRLVNSSLLDGLFLLRR